MKVGIYLNNSNQETGGGYTFEITILRIINNYHNKTKHKFVLISEGERQADLHNLEFIKLDRNSLKYGVIEKLILYGKAIFNKITGNRDPDRFNITDLEKARINDFLHSKGIEFILYLQQGQFLTFDIPYLTVVWDLQHRLQPYFPEVSINRAWQKREAALSLLLQRSTFIVTGTDIGNEQIARFYNVPSEKIIVIPMPAPAFDNEHDIGECREILEKHKVQKDYLFYPAQYWPHKNHVTLLNALKYLKDKYQLELNLVCTGSDKGNQTYIENYVRKLGLERQVRILGFISYSELIVLYKQAFALSFLSLFGPDNLPPLEAFSLGCPVLASRIEGVEEQLGDAALFVDPLSSSDVANNIFNLYKNKELREELIKKGYDHIRKISYSNYPDKIIDRLDRFELIRECWSNTEKYKRNN